MHPEDDVPNATIPHQGAASYYTPNTTVEVPAPAPHTPGAEHRMAYSSVAVLVVAAIAMASVVGWVKRHSVRPFKLMRRDEDDASLDMDADDDTDVHARADVETASRKALASPVLLVRNKPRRDASKCRHCDARPTHSMPSVVRNWEMAGVSPVNPWTVEKEDKQSPPSLCLDHYTMALRMCQHRAAQGGLDVRAYLRSQEATMHEFNSVKLGTTLLLEARKYGEAK